MCSEIGFPPIWIVITLVKMVLRMMFVEGVLASKNASAQNYIEVN